MQFDDPQQHVVTFECAPSDTNSVVHLLSADGCCGNCGAFCYRPQEIAGSVCPRVRATLPKLWGFSKTLLCFVHSSYRE